MSVFKAERQLGCASSELVSRSSPAASVMTLFLALCSEFCRDCLGQAAGMSTRLFPVSRQNLKPLGTTLNDIHSTMIDGYTRYRP